MKKVLFLSLLIVTILFLKCVQEQPIPNLTNEVVVSTTTGTITMDSITNQTMDSITNQVCRDNLGNVISCDATDGNVVTPSSISGNEANGRLVWIYNGGLFITKKHNEKIINRVSTLNLDTPWHFIEENKWHVFYAYEIYRVPNLTLQIEYISNIDSIGRYVLGTVNLKEIQIVNDVLSGNPSFVEHDGSYGISNESLIALSNSFVDEYERIASRRIDLSTQNIIKIYHYGLGFEQDPSFGVAPNTNCNVTNSVEFWMNTKSFYDGSIATFANNHDWRNERYKWTFYHEYSHDIIGLAHPTADNDNGFFDYNSLMGHGLPTSQGIEPWYNDNQVRDELLTRAWVWPEHAKICTVDVTRDIYTN